MAENSQIHAVIVENVFECSLAHCALLVSQGVPWTMACDYHPRSDSTINAGEIGLQELHLLSWGAEWSAID